MFKELVPGVRMLEADDLGIGVKEQARTSHASSAPDAPAITSTDPYVREISRLAAIYGGVILSGPPGTSKSFYASAAAEIIAGSKRRVRFVQFHASYQYEDFMLGFMPTEDGFKTKMGPFLEVAQAAADHPDDKYVLVIDELSRADVGRVFGEALTYIENTKRELLFTIANGEQIKVPDNLVILATMNPFDRGVDEVDAAFERRFAKMSMEPNSDLLGAILESNGMDPDLQRRVVSWFTRINAQARSVPAAAVGHAYFSTASDERSLDDIWNYQLKHLVERAFRRDQSNREALEAGWQNIFVTPDPPEASDETGQSGDASQPED